MEWNSYFRKLNTVEYGKQESFFWNSSFNKGNGIEWLDDSENWRGKVGQGPNLI